MTKPNHQQNPYIVGLPIYEKDKLFGRESLLISLGSILGNYFSENNESQNQKQNIKVILLQGQRRIGKTSVLGQIAQLVPENNCVFVSFDLQSHSQSSLGEILHELAETIISNIGLEPDIVIAPTEQEINRDLDIFHRDFLQRIYQNIDNKNLVILIDEFDTVENDDFHNFFKQVLIQQPKLCMITVVGRNMIISEKLIPFFKDSLNKVINLLDDDSAEALITQRFRSPLIYEQNAIAKIIELTAGHPYFTQVVCFALFVQAKLNGNWNITSQDVENIITKAIETAEAHLPSFWQDWNELERVVISTVAEAQQRAIEQNQIEPIEPFILLKEYGIIQIKELNDASRRLESNGYLSDAKRIKVELIRRWLLDKHQFNQEIEELEKFKEEEVNPIYKEANSLYQQDKKHDAINIYEQALQINPNHFKTVESLAQTYLEVENFEQAIELYTRASQFNRTRNKEKLVEALERYGDKLRSEGKLSQAKEKFERILEIDPDKKSIKHKIREIKIEIGRQNNQKPTALQQILSPRLRIIVYPIAAAGILAVGIGVNRWTTPCLAGELKVNGLFCVADSTDISRGEDHLFSDNSNQKRNEGIAEFKKGNYDQAANSFKDALKYNPNDLEVLIYYNNARARQQGKPLTLATVIPADNLPNVGKEMLRGVAQAQNQFNENKGLNGRLLEIAIANDANRREKAKDIAQELVKDPSILGIIGHYTSDTTSAALDEYTKARLAIVSPTSTSISLKSDVFFRTVPSDAATGKILGEYAKKSGINRTVIFYNRYSTYSKSLTQEFTKNFGGFTKRIDLTKPNLNLEQVVQESAKDAQAAVLFPNAEKTYLDKALQVAQANNKLGEQRLKLLGGAAIYSEETLNNARNVIEGLTLEVPWFREAPQSKTFVQKAQAQWGTKWVSWRTATSYDATQALIQALSPNASRSTVLQNLPNVNLSAQATSGDELKFQNGERQSQPILVKVEQGELKLLP